MEAASTLVAAVRYFADPDNCLSYVVARRWPEGVGCPTCGRKDVRFLAKRRCWECRAKHPHKQFSVKTGTIFEDSPLGLDKWLPAIWIIANCKNGVSSYEIHRDLGVTQKTAWFMLHRIREAMIDNDGQLSGPVESDEAYVGGKATSSDINPETGKLMPTGPQENKTIVMGIVERKGRARAFVIDNTTRATLHGKIKANVAEGSQIYTDANTSYKKMERLGKYTHFVINHEVQYVKGHIHTNHVENFWTLLKRSIRGTYICPRPKHVQRYVEEQIFRFNLCDTNDAFRFSETVRQVVGKRLTYKQLSATVNTEQARTKEKQREAMLKQLAEKAYAQEPF
jgi:transposase-like protein